MNEMVNHPRHYNAHPSGIECIDVVERMTFNLGNACKYLWRGGMKAEDATQDYKKALWYVVRSFEHDSAWLFGGAPTMDFANFMLENRRAQLILARPSPWCEPVRKSIGMIFDLHAGKPVGQRIEIYDRLRMCITTAISDQGCIGKGQEP